MRPVLALVLTVAILGGMQLFMASQRGAGHDHHRGANVIRGAGEYSVELTLTFDAGKDEFGLDAEGDAPSVLLQLHGQTLLQRIDHVPSSATLEVKPVEGIVVGENEFYLQVAPADLLSLVPRAARIRVLRDGIPLAERTLWSSPGEIVQGILAIQVSE